MKALKISLLVLVCLGLIYAVGPSVEKPVFDLATPKITSNLVQLEKEIYTAETLLNIKPENESFIQWADSSKKKTTYVVVYLHGFSASPEEGAPTHREFAKRYGCNLYVPRLFEHGLVSEEPMLNFTAEGYLKSAKEAIEIAKQLGDSVIVMACSTGATAAIYLAAHDNKIHSLILYSPNIDLYSSASTLLTLPWGYSILKLVNGGTTFSWNAPEVAKKFWHTSYRIEAIVQLKALIQSTMTNQVFNKIKQPVFLGYYYKNEEEQDKTVSVKRMHEMMKEIKTPVSKRKHVAFPEAATHGIQNHFFSKDYAGVLRETNLFAEEVLGISPQIL